MLVEAKGKSRQQVGAMQAVPPVPATQEAPILARTAGHAAKGIPMQGGIAATAAAAEEQGAAALAVMVFTV